MQLRNVIQKYSIDYSDKPTNYVIQCINYVGCAQTCPTSAQAAMIYFIGVSYSVLLTNLTHSSVLQET